MHGKLGPNFRLIKMVRNAYGKKEKPAINIFKFVTNEICYELCVN